MEPTKIPCLAKEISAWLWVELESAWALAAGMQPSPTCKRDWGSLGGRRRDFMVGCPLAVAAVHSCRVQTDRWVLILLLGLFFDCCRWSCRVTQPVQLTPLWPASWLPAVDKGRGSKSVEVQRVWEVCDERLQFMSRQDALLLDEALGADDVSKARLVWSRAAEVALVDAYRFSGGPLPSRVLVLGRGSAVFRVVRLGGHPVRKARGNVADEHDAADVFLYRDCSLAPLLGMRRSFKAVMDVLDAMIRSSISLSRSVELTIQWGRILALGPLHPVILDDLSLNPGMGIGAFYRAASGIHRRLSDFIHAVVGCRRDEAVRGWRNWIREDPMVHPCRWLRPDLVPLGPLLLCKPHLTPGGSGVLADPARIDEEFRKAWLPFFVVLGKGIPALRNSILRLRSGCRFCLRFICLG